MPDSLTDSDHRRRAELRQLLSRKFTAGRTRSGPLASHNDAYSQVRGLMASDTLFDISRESEKIRQRYGPTLFGRQALCARRLVEAGVPFVRVNRGWWDSHGENFDIHHELVPELDSVLAVLLDDLEERGLLQHTIVITMAEMGRTPIINSMRGRDHYGGIRALDFSPDGSQLAVAGIFNTDAAITNGQALLHVYDWRSEKDRSTGNLCAR